ncbi:phage tail protein [Fusobacterium polymorphum]|uniref:phage tail-collar fiber domain-containing protein n=1 Tax=Fusobacterium nucleatum subsp. polymorphum TaxID=76857 RepID=UPI0030D3D586
MAFRGLTKKGADYLATRLANELAVEFLKVEIGDGAVVSGQNPKNQTSLISYKKDVRILKKEQENNAINLTIQITNDDITQGFYLKEIGIYVNDSSSNGCLYWYCNEDNAQYIPAKTDSVIAFEIDIRMEVTNSDATIINWSGKNTWINKEYLEENYTQNGEYKGTAQEIEDRVVAAVGKEDGKFPLNEAIQGNVYYFPANKKFYICKETQNRKISVPDVKFEELSIWENRKRLENFSKFYEYNFNVPGLTFARLTKIANIVTFTVDSGSLFLNKPSGSIVLNLPEGFRPKTYVYFSSLYLNSNKGGVFRIDPNGNVVKAHNDDNVGAYYFSVTFPIN